MKYSTFVAAGLSVLLQPVRGHYVFQQLTYAGVKGAVSQYIRPNTNYNSPVTDLTSPDLRCNVGGASGAGTQTLAVTAGSSFTFTADVAVYHQGPLSIYMAKAPTTAAAFDGSGAVWFKIYDLGPTFDASGGSSWVLEQSYTASFPKDLPNGDYLLRIQQLGIHNPWPAGIPQFYVECAQVTVSGGGSGVPGPLVSIPGFVDGTEPGYTVNIYVNFHNYTIPGPPVWTGGSVKPTNVASTTTAKTTTTSKVSTTLKTSVTTTTSKATTTTSKASTTTTGAAGTVPLFGQCGGSTWQGATTCVSGATCTVVNAFYSQCL